MTSSETVVQEIAPLVLIADDQVPTTVMLERVFEYEGYRVKSVYDGVTAIETARNILPDLILLDVNMPGINGFEVLKRLRQDDKTTNIPTILITAMGELSDVVQGLNLGADDYLRKPFHPQELLARAQSKMKSRKLEENLHQRTQELEALLRVSEELSQHLETQDLFEFILYLSLDLLKGDIAAIYHLKDANHIEASCIKSKDGKHDNKKFDESLILDFLASRDTALLWPEEPALFPEYDTGMMIPLQYGGKTHGLIMIMRSDASYGLSHLRLFSGVGKQATLAIQNAELYEVQQNYAMHLQEMVNARTAELESAQHMLIRSEKLASVGRLAASIAHEINNPLLPIRINLEHMREDLQTDGRIEVEDIERTQDSVERISRIVSRLLQFTGKRQQDRSTLQTLDVNNMLESIMTLNHKFFEQEDIALIATLREAPLIHGNKDQLEQVFMNLMLNAKAAMDRGGKLEIRTSSLNNEVIVELIDTGHGIPEDMIESIFEPFVSTKEEGTGLGLFISFDIVQNHNGVLEVSSEVGKGTTFTVRLPASDVETTETPTNS